jgi:phosphoglycerate kinase
MVTSPIVSTLPTANLHNKTVFLRADLNITLQEGAIVDDFKLLRALPTLSFLKNRCSRIVLATHIGNPTEPTPALSTKLLIPWFEQNGFPVEFVNSIDAIARATQQILLLENLRFLPGEQTHDDTFAHALAQTADYYINDAFGASHRSDTSLTLVPACFPSERKSYGFLIEQETNHLNRIVNSEHLLLLIGGAKVKTKLPLLRHLVAPNRTIIVLPPLSFTFLKALGYSIGKSLVVDELIPEALAMIQYAHTHNCTFIMPLDYQISYPAIQGSLNSVEYKNIPDDAIGISVGEKTLELIASYIHTSDAIFFNGPMGFLNRPETVGATINILKQLQQSTAYTVIGGGDTVSYARTLQLSEEIDFISTGGGATLAYLAHQEMPGLSLYSFNK